jgi:hypothetical protein
MSRRIDSRDVFDPNARTLQRLDGRVLGRFRRLGPNRWDPYEFLAEDGGSIRVLARVKIQLEPRGAVFRMRWRSRVIRVEWVPDARHRAELKEGSWTARKLFRARFSEDFQNRPGFGLAAVVASKLSRKRRRR